LGSFEPLFGFKSQGSYTQWILPLRFKLKISQNNPENLGRGRDFEQDLMNQKEEERLVRLSYYELDLRQKGYFAIAGIDEAGRGPLAGPVVAAACILPPYYKLLFLNDSKKLSVAKRESLFSKITEDKTVVFGIGVVSEKRIDEINILQATFEAMQQAVGELALNPDYLLIDGTQVPVFSCPAQAIVKGDSLSISIAAASVIAKVTRDRWMVKQALQYPEYGFEKHKGYPTKDHREMIRKYGISPLHRKSFCHTQSDTNFRK